MKTSFEYLQLKGAFIELSCINVKLYFLFVTLYLALALNAQ